MKYATFQKKNIYDISALMLIPLGPGGQIIDLVLLSCPLHSKNGSMEVIKAETLPYHFHTIGVYIRVCV